MVIKMVRRKLSYSIILLFFLGLLAGCGDDNGSSSSENQNDNTQTTDSMRSVQILIKRPPP